jgi:hypothetical protein
MAGKGMIRCSFCGSRKHASANCPTLPKGRTKPRKKPPSYQENMAKLAKRGPRDDYPSGSDALSKRLPGSYESGKKR